MSKINNKYSGFIIKRINKLIAVALMIAMTPNVLAANKGNISAAVNTLIIGTVVAIMISLVFALQKDQEGRLSGLKTGKFFLLLSILLLIVFVTGTASFFIFM